VRKEDVLRELNEARAKLLGALEGLSADQMLMPGAVGIWSVKDVLAHIATWESELVTALSQVQNRRVPSMLAIEDIDDWNEDQYHANVQRPLEAVLADLEGVHRVLCRKVEEFDERSLIDNRRYKWMEGEPLAYLIQETASWHEREHAEEIRAWRQRQGL
jgi:uncharacterized damage-inducible protein DinB